MPEETIKDLALKFAEKNPSLLREIMESHWIRFKELEFSQGKQIRGSAEKNYKEIK